MHEGRKSLSEAVTLLQEALDAWRSFGVQGLGFEALGSWGLGRGSGLGGSWGLGSSCMSLAGHDTARLPFHDVD